MARTSNLQGKLLITGHTGFKGAWLTLLAEELGLEVAGVSLPPTENSLYLKLNRHGRIEEYFVDINDNEELKTVIHKIKPRAVLHLAAQALVEDSYRDPLETFQTNVMGTAHVLDVCTNVPEIEFIGVATTDKVYKNSNLGIDFIETDSLGGKDPYSASKVGTESVVDAWRQLSILRNGPGISSFRAGNVIGGGDLAENRIVPDLIRSRVSGEPAPIRYPDSTRPWQHVLDPLMGYLIATNEFMKKKELSPAINFGPSGTSLKVSELVQLALSVDSKIPQPDMTRPNNDERESRLLSLNSDLARNSLGWTNSWSQEEAIRSSFTWWKAVLEKQLSPLEACKLDISILLGR